MNILNNELIFLDIESTSKYELLDTIIEKTFSLGLISDISEVKKSVLVREQEAPTEVGLSVAMPHGRNSFILTPCISFARLSKPITWQNEQVDLVFLILVPSDKAEKLHLKYISELSRKLLDTEFRESLYKIKNVEEIVI